MSNIGGHCPSAASGDTIPVPKLMTGARKIDIIHFKDTITVLGKEIEMKSKILTPRIQPFFPDTQRCGPSILECHHFLHALLNLVSANDGSVPVQEGLSPSETVIPSLLPVQQFLMVMSTFPAAEL